MSSQLSSTLIPPKPKSSRRRLLKRVAIAAGAAGLCTAGYAFALEPHWLEVVERDLPLAGLPDSLAGKTIVQLSDLHIGRTWSRFLDYAIDQANQLQPDVVVITGDFMSCQAKEQTSAVSTFLQRLKPTPLGTYACLGNHDYGAGWSLVPVADALVETLSAIGITTLRNQSITLSGGLVLIGLEDLWSPNWNVRKATEVLSSAVGQPAITLCHNPDACDLSIWSDAGYRGWILAGHTHGGQCKPPFLPPPMLPVRNRLYTCGHFPISPGIDLYINRATGNLRQVRFNCRPEITVFRLASIS